uniref:7TM GPCR serpentine receptor class x (Srx) domain-containing protein n=1 Tax=Ditylenchus dipsaci TaxID=166011 RepID=A0A915DRK1_9BILA
MNTEKNAKLKLKDQQGFVNVTQLLEFVWLFLEILFNYILPVPARFSILVLRFLAYCSHLHALLIATNRAHAFFSPTTYKNVWTKRFTIMSCLTCWSLSFSFAFFSVFIIKVNPLFFKGHSIDFFSLQDFTAYLTPLEGVANQYFISVYMYTIFPLTAFLIYSVTLVKLLWEKWLKRNTKLSNQMREQLNRRCQLLLPCFFSFLPGILTQLQGYIRSVPPPFGYIYSAFLVMSLCAVEPFVLLGSSKVIRQNFPFSSNLKKRKESKVTVLVTL